MKFYDTRQRKIIDFKVGSPVNIYVCGITPYDSAHLGHIFTFLTYDLLQRRLEELGHKVTMVRNITDVDEPIFERARANGETYQELAERETKKFQSIMHDLNFRPAASEPLASDFVLPMASAIAKLLAGGQAYKLGNDIYFDVARAADFGKFCGFSDKLQLTFMLERGGDPGRVGKRQQLDFLLWRGVSDASDPAAWDSPIGRGRPGWHIECSVMSSSILGAPLDLHGGGLDLIFPHHECEIAQSQALGLAPPARHWLHVAPLLLHGEKISKSLGNLLLASALLQNYSPPTIRLSLMHYHYRIGGEWQPDYLLSAHQLAQKIQTAQKLDNGQTGQAELNAIRADLDNDLDTPSTLKNLDQLADKIINARRQKSANRPTATPLDQALRLLGIAIKP
ncbi:MAG: cysteine--tRNA ligase [Candidatus Saccharimonadales bacterium]